MDRLNGLKTDKQLDSKFREALTTALTSDKTPTHVLVRAGFLKHPKRAAHAHSDRSPAALVERPPLARLIAPRGIALRTELTALFLAQVLPGGAKQLSELNVEPEPGDVLSWRGVLGVVAAHSPTARVAATEGDNRVRQIKKAFDKLSDPTLGLVELPHSGTKKRKYESVRLLVETGAQATDSAARYKAPKSTEALVEVPVEFFTNGWVYVLEDSEIAAWLMFRTWARVAYNATGADFRLSGDDRQAYFGLGKNIWNQHRRLSRLGLMDVDADPRRRENGTMEDFAKDGNGRFHVMRMTDEGLSKPALPSMLAALAEELDELP